MNPLDRLSEYLGMVERRLRVLALTRGAAITAAAALIFTVLVVLVVNAFAFSDHSVLWGRFVLFLSLALAVGLGLVIPLFRLNRRRAAREAEEKFPQFQERLLTFAERANQDPQDPFLELLAADTLEMAETAEPERLVRKGWLVSFISAAAVALAVLLWLGSSGPGYLGYGTSLLWGGIPKADQAPYYSIVVQPGTRTVRRKSDQVITARLVGFQADRVRVSVRYQDSTKWEAAEMRLRPGGPGYEFLLAGIPQSLDYYVDAGHLRSKTYRLNVVDLPSVKHIRVTYHFPDWSGMRDKVEDPGGDLRAVAGTVADVAIETDKPLSNGTLLLDDGSRLPLRIGEGNWLSASVSIRRDGLYHVASVEGDEPVRLSEDYFIEAQKDQPPVVRITRPGRDARVNPIEEVAVAVDAQDDFGLKNMALHYSVNGGPEKTVPLLKNKNVKSADASTTLYLEDFRMSPGDIVSLYASASDARAASKTDMFFIQAEPFEREFMQSQQSGGGGAGGPEEGQISQRQKEIIAATWNQLKDKSGDKAAAAENARFLSEVQSKLRDQARSLALRMRRRQISGANQSFQSFAEDMEKAVAAMGPAADKLKGLEWQQALPPEQQALQHLLRAEATFRQIQVAFGARGGGGAQGGLGRDLEGLFDLELDTEKNQYESGRQTASADQRQRQLDEALQKLEQLARRQQALAEQQRRKQLSTQQRWEQEMLRREAEQLQRQMEQLSRGGSSSQSQSGRQGQQSRMSSMGQNGQMQSANPQLERAIRNLEQAIRDMRQSASQSEAEARRAADGLKAAQDALSGLRQQQTSTQVDELARKAEQLARQQEDFGKRLRQEFGYRSLLRQDEARGAQRSPAQRSPAQRDPQEMAGEKQQILDEYERLQREIQKAARDLAGTQPEVSSKLRDALGNAQQNEPEMRMRWATEAIRRGLGAYAVMREATVTQTLNSLSDQLKQAQEAMSRAAGRQDGDQQKLEQALAQAEQLRQKLEQVARRIGEGRQQASTQQGRQGGQQGQAGGNGQQSSPQGSGQAGRAQGGSASGSFAAINRGERRAGAPARPGSFPSQPLTAEEAEHAFRDALRGAARLEQSLQGNPEITRDVQEMIREMQRLDPRRFSDNPELAQRLSTQVIGQMEQVELRLRRLLNDRQGGDVLTGGSEPVPPGYAEAVAEYFRRLSRK